MQDITDLHEYCNLPTYALRFAMALLRMLTRPMSKCDNLAVTPKRQTCVLIGKAREEKEGYLQIPIA